MHSRLCCISSLPCLILHRSNFQSHYGVGVKLSSSLKHVSHSLIVLHSQIQWWPGYIRLSCSSCSGRTNGCINTFVCICSYLPLVSTTSHGYCQILVFFSGPQVGEFKGVHSNPPFDLQKILYTPLNCHFKCPTIWKWSTRLWLLVSLLWRITAVQKSLVAAMRVCSW